MADRGPVVMAVVLFVLAEPGAAVSVAACWAAKGKLLAFGNMRMSGPSIPVHTIIFFCLTTIFLLALGVHIHTS